MERCLNMTAGWSSSSVTYIPIYSLELNIGLLEEFGINIFRVSSSDAPFTSASKFDILEYLDLMEANPLCIWLCCSSHYHFHSQVQ